MSAKTRYLSTLAVLALFLFASPLHAQEAAPESDLGAEETEGEELEYHRNHFGGFFGGSTRMDGGETAVTMGLEYARQFHPRWAVASYLEVISSQLERDLVFIVTGVFYPIPRLGLALGPGFEAADRVVDEDGEIAEENELELLMRAGVGYGFALTETAALGPAVLADFTRHRVTLVYGLSMVVGF